MPDILRHIQAYKLSEIAAQKRLQPLASVEAQARRAPPPRGFLASIERRRTPAVIAEIKRASPSKGLIRSDFDPSRHAAAYERAGATCLSVLTDTPSFQGSPEHLQAARAATSLPVLRKDFLFDPYQVIQARAWGADCILIIMAAVDDDLASELEATAFAWSMDALIEVHDAAELERATRLRSRLIGINNRNLKTFHTSLTTTQRLAPHVPPGRITVAESGIETHADIQELASYGAQAYLVGESLMRAKDLEQATRSLITTAP